MRHLIHRALLRRFVGTPTQNLRAVTEPAAGKMIVGDFHDYLRIDRFPFAGSFRAPAARAAGGVASESGLLFERFKFLCERTPFAGFERRSETDVMQQTVIIVQAEEQ